MVRDRHLVKRQYDEYLRVPKKATLRRKQWTPTSIASTVVEADLYFTEGHVIKFSSGVCMNYTKGAYRIEITGINELSCIHKCIVYIGGKEGNHNRNRVE